MEENAVNLAVRTFLKQFGIASQREMEVAARSGKGGKTLKVQALLKINGTAAHTESAEIPLE
jgi:Family of unknown function (DUF6494)